MSKVPEKSRDEDGDYEIVSFEDFCDKSPSSKADLLNLNDNINYRLCFGGDAAGKYNENLCEVGEGSSRQFEAEKETTLSEKSVNWKRKAATTFAPFGKYGNRPRKSSLLGGVMSKPRTTEGDSSKQHRYERFSSQRSLLENIRGNMPSRGVSCLLLLCVIGAAAAWWGVAGALSGSWGDEHYRRLWERAHPDGHPPHAPPTHPVEKQIPTEYRYHDHNNLSTKNKNATLKKEINKKSNDVNERVTQVSENDVPVCSRIVDDNMRFDCFPQEGANEEGCLKRGCCWNATITQNKTIGDGIPYCFYPENYETFRFINMTETKHGMTAYYEKRLASGYPNDFDFMKIEFRYVNTDVLRIRITDPVNRRFEPPYPEVPIMANNLSEKSYKVVFEIAEIGFKVIRNSDNVTIMDTTKGGIVMSDKFLQISNLLPTNKLYGLGEHRAKFLVDMNWKTRTLFNFDAPPTENLNGYGMHPFFLALENNGNAHGVVLLNSNAMDVVLQPTPAITYRTVGGILNFYVMLGPTPTQVTQQYYALIGYPFLPPYWSLGFHLCKYNYGSLNVTKHVWMNNRNAGIPFDVQWNDLDYMNNSNDFTYDKNTFYGLPDFVKKLHKEGMKYMLLIDPGISSSEREGTYPPYDRGLELNVFIKNSTGDPFAGKVWNRMTTVYPDFTHPNSTTYWVDMIERFHKMIPFDGAWIDMNEPSNFISGQMYGKCEPEDLPYTPRTIGKDGLKTKTLCMDAQHWLGKHFDWHALYSYMEAVTTRFAMQEVRGGGRPFVISRSTYPGIGKYAGHWSGDIASDWHDMRMTIPELLNFNLFGIPMMGADICGFRGDTTPGLCKRWMQLGAFYPFSRNHNSDTSIPQDPYSLGPEVVAASREALRVRYSLLPYYYTLFWLAHTRGDTVARPLFYQFPTDQNTHAIDEQFLIGPGLLISPILYSNFSTSSAYLPDAHHWCSVRSGQCYPKGRFDLYERDTVLLGGGHIIVSQSLPDSGPITTKLVRKFPLNIQAVEDKDGLAEGVFYSDDGEKMNSYSEKRYTHIKFQIKERKLTSQVIWWGFGVPPINNITIYGLANEVVSVTLDDNLCSMPKCNFVFDEHKFALRIFNLSLSLDKPFAVSWTLQKKKGIYGLG